MPRPPSSRGKRFACLLCCLPSLVAAETILVSPDGPITIQFAISSAHDGDVIELLDGTFTGPGNRDIQFFGKAITLRSHGGDPTLCILDAEGAPGDDHRVFDLDHGEGLDTVIEAVTITGGRHWWGGGMNCSSGYPTVRRCRFVNNVSTGEGGALVVGGSARFEDCWFEGNAALSGGGASAANGWNGTAVFERCTFARNEAQLHGGGFRT